MTTVFQNVLDVIEKIPKGKVMTYGQIAQLLGMRNVQVVGYALHSNPDPQKYPCHRVIKKNGELAVGYAFGGWQKQKELLENEGVKFTENRVDMEKHQFTP
ncbi:MAG: MGMT family protein [Patescibacteria group bacterium]|jgi:methylated-DNA-protein-cysteine methyltransferase-like protein